MDCWRFIYIISVTKTILEAGFRIRVVGFARGKEVAEQLVLQIIQDMYDETGGRMEGRGFFLLIEVKEPQVGVR